MSGLNSRFIWNTRYFHIAKNNEQLSSFAISGDHARGLVEYCGTRETVALNFTDELKDKPATEKQIELIEELSRSVPNYKNTLEYEDYKKAPTRKNASELISVLSEELLIHGGFNEAANLVEYAAKRPGVVKVGTHGLFSFEENVDLKKAQEEIAGHEGNIWTHVLSLRREDADRLGYDNQSSWRSLVKSELPLIAEAHNIKLSNLRWYGAMHNTSYHPHIHLFVFSENPNEGYFSNKGSNNSFKKCKQAFATKIFAGDLENEYVSKTEFREELKNSTKEILNKLTKNPLAEYSAETQKALVNKLTTLSNSISHKKEVKYGYLKQDLKELVNDIQKILVYENKLLSELYMKWCEHQFNIEKIYIKEPSQVPIEENNEFIPIKNYIIKIAQQLHNGGISINSHENIDDISKSNSINNQFSADLSQYPDSDISTDKVFSELLSQAYDISYRDGDTCCKVADCYFFGKGTKKDIGQAMMWYGIAADQYHNGIASYRLANIYENESTEKNLELSKNYYKQAYYDLKFGIKNWECFNDIESGKDVEFFYDKTSKNDAFKEFIIGKMYYDGKCVPQDYKKAINSFLVASENGNSNAQYYLGTMCMNGIGTDKDMSLATEFLMKSAYNGNKYSAYSLYKHYSHNQQETLATSFLKMASEHGHPIAQIKIADLELEIGNLQVAKDLYIKATTKGIADAHFKLANIYNNPDTLEYNLKKANEHFSKAFNIYISDYTNSPNGFLAYNIATMYHNGYGVDKNSDEAIKWYKIASEHNGKNYEQEINSAQQQFSLPLGVLGSTVLHIGRVFRNNTLKSHKNRYTPDKKTLKQERERKLRAGQAQDDFDNYDYDY